MENINRNQRKNGEGEKTKEKIIRSHLRCDDNDDDDDVVRFLSLFLFQFLSFVGSFVTSHHGRPFRLVRDSMNPSIHQVNRSATAPDVGGSDVDDNGVDDDVDR